MAPLSYIALLLFVSLVFLWLRFPGILFKALARSASFLLGFRRRHVTVDGIDWVFIDNKHRGDSPDKPVLLLVHGFGADKYMWLGYSNYLRKHYRIVAPDLPGFGETVFPDIGDFSPRSQSARLESFCEALGIPGMHVAGSSMGGYISCWFAVDYPARLRSLTLMNAAGVLGERASPVEEAAERGENPLVVGNDEELDKLLSLLSFKRIYIPGFIRRALLADFAQRSRLLDTIFWTLVESSLTDGLVDEVSGINTPTLIIWGRQDEIIDVSCADVLHHEIRDSQLQIFDRIGHVPMFELPAATARLHTEFMQRST